MKKLMIVLSLFVSMNLYADERNKLFFEIDKFAHIATTDRITLDVTATATTTIDEINYIKVANGYDVSCKDYPKDTYKHSGSASKNVDGFVLFGHLSNLKSNKTDGSSYATGYPMFDAWAALEGQTEAIPCTIFYKSIAGYSGTQITASISGFGFGISGNFGPNIETKEKSASEMTFMRPTLTTGNGGSDGNACAVETADCGGEPPEPYTDPLLIDLGQDGIHLGEAGVAVAFDMIGDGNPISMQWVAYNTNEAFLVQDLNHNGVVDDGSELFGNGTEMVPLHITSGATDRELKSKFSTPIVLNIKELAPNGFVALAQYDHGVLGGNNDGYISPQDSIWSQLSLWLDTNADGVSTSDEMLQLDDVGITQLDIIPKQNNRMDAAGNSIPMWSWAKNENAVNHGKYKMVDVFFKPLP
ncbi:MAG: hypothetical protein HRT35_31525 [Algicola sp.]|nr:hypothetical protein [Algicola sp.]